MKPHTHDRGAFFVFKELGEGELGAGPGGRGVGGAVGGGGLAAFLGVARPQGAGHLDLRSRGGIYRRKKNAERLSVERKRRISHHVSRHTSRTAHPGSIHRASPQGRRGTIRPCGNAPHGSHARTVWEWDLSSIQHSWRLVPGKINAPKSSKD